MRWPVNPAANPLAASAHSSDRATRPSTLETPQDRAPSRARSTRQDTHSATSSPTVHPRHRTAQNTIRDPSLQSSSDKTAIPPQHTKSMRPCRPRDRLPESFPTEYRHARSHGSRIQTRSQNRGGHRMPLDAQIALERFQAARLHNCRGVTPITALKQRW